MDKHKLSNEDTNVKITGELQNSINKHDERTRGLV